jgi:uncharacterized protein (DUF4213/DUF364 family)
MPNFLDSKTNVSSRFNISEIGGCLKLYDVYESIQENYIVRKKEQRKMVMSETLATKDTPKLFPHIDPVIYVATYYI